MSKTFPLIKITVSEIVRETYWVSKLHPIQTKRGWIEASKLKKNDVVMIVPDRGFKKISSIREEE